jgi:1-deoxy-D-xylulose-5-phosphate synthase
MKKGLKDIVAPQGMFEDLGLKYVGPVDGHDEQTLERALRNAKDFGGPVLVHVITQKGRGYQPAMDDDADQFHGVGKFNPETGLPFEVGGRIWTDEFNDEMVAIGRDRPDVVAITAAMLIPVGLDGFAATYPDRVFDVGIAEQHAATMAAGLAFSGLHPVVAVYATFLNRAFDQLLMDCALHKAGVTFVLDRAGVTGSDGASHNGMWDMTLTSVVPGLRLAAPRDGDQVRRQLREAVDVSDAPTVIRFPKGDVAEPVRAVRSHGDVDILFETGEGDVDVLIVGIGAFAAMSVDVGEKIAAHGRSVRVIDPRWVLPVSDDVVSLARGAGAVAVVEDNLVSGGIGSAVTLAARDAGLEVPVHLYGIPKRFLHHASRGQLLEELGLTADSVAVDLERRLG